MRPIATNHNNNLIAILMSIGYTDQLLEDTSLDVITLDKAVQSL